MKINVFLTAVALILLIIVAPRYGLLGVAFALLGLSLLELSAKSFLAYTKSGIYFLSDKAFKILLVGIFFSGVFGLFIRLDFRLFLLIFPLAFFSVLYIFQCIDKNDLFVLRQRILRQTSNSDTIF